MESGDREVNAVLAASASSLKWQATGSTGLIKISSHLLSDYCSVTAFTANTVFPHCSDLELYQSPNALLLWKQNEKGTLE